MEEVQFYRGKKIQYNADTHKDGIFFATDKGEILLDGVSYGSVDIDTELKATSLNPVTSAGIYAGILKLIETALNSGNIPARILIREEGNKQYRLYLLNKEGEEISSSDTLIIGEQSSDVVLGGTFFNINSDVNQQIKKGNSAKFSCYYDRRDDEGYSTATEAIIRVLKGEEVIQEFEVEANSNFTIEINESYATTDSRTVFTLQAIPVNDGVELTEETKTRTVTVLIIDFTLSLNGYSLANAYTVGDVINIPYIFSGYLGEKTVRVYVDGVREDSDGNILYPEQTVTEGGTFSISTQGWSAGTHNIQIHAFYTTSDENVIYSNLIYIAVPIKGEVASFGCVFNLDIESPIALGQIPTLNVDLYKSFSFDFYASNLETSRVVEFYSEGSLISDYNVTTNIVSVNYKYNETGTKLCKLYCGNQEFSFNVNVIKSDYVVYATNNPALYLTALGKSNQSLSKDVWEYNGITSTFEGFNWDTDGWIISNEEPALRLIAGDKVTINCKPLEYYDNASNAFTFMVKFKASAVANENQVLISCFNEEGIGFEVTGTEAYYKNSQGLTISTKFAPNETYNIAFTVFLKLDESTEYNKLRSLQMFLYVNGVMSGNAQMASTASIYQGLDSTNITIQAPSCTLDIFSIRYYKQACSETEMFSSYLVDLNNPALLESEYLSNQVLDSYGNVSLEKALSCGIPCILVTGSFTNAGNNYNAVDYVAAMNDKNPKYDVEQILYLESKEASERNFLAIPKSEDAHPQLRLQGTSSLNYPIKNFRIYTKSSKMFLNVGIDDLYKSVADIEQLEADGTYVAKSKPKFALRENSAPVNCWCLKADFAEASSSHNTGFAKLVHDLSMQLGSLTPPQKYKSEDYEYEIRTTIDGYPCLLFSRETTSDTPVFRGKFNFNNDKSTEEVFGFVDIDGYHDKSDEMQEATDNSMEWLMDSFEYLAETTDSEGNTGYVKKTMECAPIKELLGSNPVECWEFLNNEHPFGDFKNVDFNSYTVKHNDDYDFDERTYDWMNCWEARYPDEDDLNLAFAAGAVKPHYLETLALWIMSTDTLNATGNTIDAVTYGNKTYTTDSAEYRKAKFSNELSLYFNVSFLCEYYVLNDMVAGADQRKKNMMWAFWYDKSISDDTTSPLGKVRCYPIYYDNDTILGVDNSGKITVPWDADENTITDTSYTFAGHDSVIWKNLRECMSSTLKSTYRRIRAVADNDFIKSYFNQKQSEIYGEVVFNKDSIFKYLRSDIIGTAHKDGSNITPEFPWDSFADYIQGTRKAHRDWFINKRLDWFDNKNAASGFVSADLRFKGGIGYIPYYTFKTAKDAYYSITSDQITNIDTYHTLVTVSDDEYDYKFELDQTPGPGATYHIYGLNNVSEFDLSHWAGFNSFVVGVVFSNLEKLTLGNIEYAPIRTSDGISFSSYNYPQLKYLDVSNMLGSTAKPYVNADLSELLYLETFIATGCSNLTTATFASGGNISRIVLPENFKNLYLVNLPKLTKEGIEWGSCERPLWGITTDSEGNEIISKLEKTETLTASYASIQQLHIENCQSLDAMDLVNTILNTENSKLQAIRVVGVNMVGNGQDLIALYDKGIKGLLVSNDGAYNIDSAHCSITGTYQLSTLLDDTLYQNLCAYFNELEIKQPEYTTISFDLTTSSPEKVTNFDNSTGRLYGKTYAPSGHVKKILDQRHAYMVKGSETAGLFYAAQLRDDNSYYYNDDVAANLTGSDGDYCMYEPHYWYKGINDHVNRIMYVLFSSNESEPTQAVGTSIPLTSLTAYSGKQFNTTNTITTETDSLQTSTVDQTTKTALYNAYEYILPDSHNYKQFRVAGVASTQVGCIVTDSNGQILKRLSSDLNKGMYDGSYLFSTIPDNAYKICFTVSASIVPEYYLYLTESSEIEAIEPKWVEHKECFVGRIMTTLYNNAINSAFIIQDGSTSVNTYPVPETAVTVKEACEAITGKGSGYYPADYEVLKDIIILAYAKYGRTDMHSSVTGAGYKSDGTCDRYDFYYYKPGNVDYVEYGITDTSTNGDYISYYTKDDVQYYPEVVTLMGYHQFVGGGSTAAYSDKVSMNTKLFTSSRTGRSVKVFASTAYKYNLYILGGRYVDIFGTGVTDSTTTGFCGEEYAKASTGTGLVEFGFCYSRNTYSPVTYSVNVTNGVSVSTTISNMYLTNLQRILIVPDLINIITDSNTFKTL